MWVNNINKVTYAKQKTSPGRAPENTPFIVTVVLIGIIIAVLFANGWFDELLSDLGGLAGTTEAAYTGPAEELLAVHFIDVGQGDCTLIITPEGETMLIDTGEDSQSNTVIAYLDICGVKTIDYLVLTHPHSDHIGSAHRIIENTG